MNIRLSRNADRHDGFEYVSTITSKCVAVVERSTEHSGHMQLYAQPVVEPPTRIRNEPVPLVLQSAGLTFVSVCPLVYLLLETTCEGGMIQSSV